MTHYKEKTKLGEKYITLRKRTYKILVSYFPEYKKNCWEPFRVYDYGLCERMDLMTRAQENAFPKTLGYEAQEFAKTFD